MEVNLMYKADSAKNPLKALYLISLIEERIKDDTGAMSFSLRLAIENNEPAINIISMLKHYINDVESVCNIIDLLGVELVERVKTFEP